MCGSSTRSFLIYVIYPMICDNQFFQIIFFALVLKIEWNSMVVVRYHRCHHRRHGTIVSWSQPCRPHRTTMISPWNKKIILVELFWSQRHGFSIHLLLYSVTSVPLAVSLTDHLQRTIRNKPLPLSAWYVGGNDLKSYDWIGWPEVVAHGMSSSLISRAAQWKE